MSRSSLVSSGSESSAGSSRLVGMFAHAAFYHLGFSLTLVCSSPGAIAEPPRNINETGFPGSQASSPSNATTIRQDTPFAKETEQPPSPITTGQNEASRRFTMPPISSGFPHRSPAVGTNRATTISLPPDLLSPGFVPWQHDSGDSWRAAPIPRSASPDHQTVKDIRQNVPTLPHSDPILKINSEEVDEDDLIEDFRKRGFRSSQDLSIARFFTGHNQYPSSLSDVSFGSMSSLDSPSNLQPRQPFIESAVDFFLQTDDLDTTILVARRIDGKVQAGTLAGLVRELVYFDQTSMFFLSLSDSRGTLCLIRKLV